MRIIDGYIFRSIIVMTLMVLGVLLSVGGFIEFVSQLDDIGTGAYGVTEALMYAGLKLPRFAVGVLPVSVLLGGLLGMGALATHSELIVLRASGVSLMMIGRSALYTGIALAVVGALLAESIAPPLDRYARQMKTLTKNSDMRMAVAGSTWLRDGSLFLNITEAENGIGFGGVFIYNVNPENNGLLSISRARSAEVYALNNWVFNDYSESVFVDEGTVVSDSPTTGEPGQLNADVLELTEVRTSSLSGFELYSYIDYLKSNGLDAEEYEIAFWGRMAGIAGIAIMSVLAVPFVMGSLRSGGAGARMLVGLAIGLGYFLFNSIAKDTSDVFNLNPFLMGWMPTVILAVLTVVLLLRTR